MGRVTYDEQLRKRTVGYSFNLVHLDQPTAIDDIQRLLIAKIVTTIRELENGLDPAEQRRIEKVYIGKTYIATKREQGRYGKLIPFNPRDPDTWLMTGINSRHNAHRKKDYGRDGMVVLCAITNETMTEGCRVNHEQYALAVEQKLLHHYLITHPDSKVANDTFATGREGDHEGYVIYMTFTYAPRASASASSSTSSTSGGGGTTATSGTATSGTATSGTATSGTATSGTGTASASTSSSTSGGGDTTVTSATSGAGVTAAKDKDERTKKKRRTK